MRLFGARLGDQVQNTATGATKLRREAIGHDLELLNRFLRDHELLGHGLPARLAEEGVIEVRAVELTLVSMPF